MFGPDFWKELRKVITASVLLGLVCAVNAQAQITATLRSVTVRSAVEFLQKEYQYSFTMSTDQVDINAQVNVEAKNAPLRSVLDQIFAGQNVSYRINGKHITVTSANNAVQARSSKAADSGAEFSGIILDEEKLPMPGAAIMEQGTTNGTNADADGRFHFNTKGSSPTLVISFFGYEDVVLPMKGSKNNLEIRMYPQMQTLDDAVVVGYGTMTRRDITSAIGQFRPKASERRDVLSVDQFLQGRIAGVHISTASGIPGASSRVSIRGIGSLTAGNEPLYVIDGVPLTSTTGDTGAFTQAESLTGLATLNPSDIESVEVLKDAASAAIYGSRATNGVIIITTKSGKKGAPRVTVDASTSWSVQPRTETLEIASPDLMIETFNEASSIISISSICGIIGTVISGFISDWWFKGSRNVPAVIFGLMNVLGLGLFLFGSAVRWNLILSMVIFGLAIGALICYLGGLMAVDIAPKQSSGAALGVVGIASYIGAAIQDFVSGMTIESGKSVVPGTYDFSAVSWFWFGSAVLSVVLTVAVWMLSRKPRP